MVYLTHSHTEIWDRECGNETVELHNGCIYCGISFPPFHVIVTIPLQYTRSEKLAPGGGGASRNSSSGVDAMTGVEQEGETSFAPQYVPYCLKIQHLQ